MLLKMSDSVQSHGYIHIVYKVEKPMLGIHAR